MSNTHTFTGTASSSGAHDRTHRRSTEETHRTSAPADPKALHASARWMVLTYLLTTVHHVYSSTFIEPDASVRGMFAGQWRAHGFLPLLIPVAIGLGALLAYRRRGDRRWLAPYALVSGGLFTGVVGIWEGGWNHLAKLVVFALGLQDSYAYGPSWLLQFPAVQPPKDVFFEATGVLTLVFGVVNAYYLGRLLVGRRRTAAVVATGPGATAPGAPRAA